MEEQTQTPRRWWRRTILGVGVPWWLGFAATAALAAWLVAFPFGGSITTATFTIDATSGGTSVLSGDCSIVQEGGAYTLTWDNAVGGDSCQVELGVQTSAENTVDAAVQGFDLVTDAPAGAIIATFDNDCGLLVPPGSLAGDISPVLTVSLTDESGPSATYDLTGSSVGWVPAGLYDDTACS